jgi:hypothetical protein
MAGMPFQVLGKPLNSFDRIRRTNAKARRANPVEISSGLAGRVWGVRQAKP